MSVFEHRITAVTLAAALTIGLSQSATAQTAQAPSVGTERVAGYHAKTPVTPPAPLADSKPGARPAGAAWIPGFWDLQGNPSTAPNAGWVWVPGRWEEPPVPGAKWDEAHWGWNDDWWTWIPGHWDEPKQRK
jgi:hypothetical protein